MTKARQHQLKQSRLAARRARKQGEQKKKRLADERAGIDRFAERMARIYPPVEMTPEEREYQRACSAIEDARLLAKFGPKNLYDDWEVEEAIAELEAEGAYPVDSGRA